MTGCFYALSQVRWRKPAALESRTLPHSPGDGRPTADLGWIQPGGASLRFDFSITWAFPWILSGGGLGADVLADGLLEQPANPARTNTRQQEYVLRVILLSPRFPGVVRI